MMILSSRKKSRRDTCYCIQARLKGPLLYNALVQRMPADEDISLAYSEVRLHIMLTR